MQTKPKIGLTVDWGALAEGFLKIAEAKNMLGVIAYGILPQDIMERFKHNYKDIATEAIYAKHQKYLDMLDEIDHETGYTMKQELIDKLDKSIKTEVKDFAHNLTLAVYRQAKMVV